MVRNERTINQTVDCKEEKDSQKGDVITISFSPKTYRSKTIDTT